MPSRRVGRIDGTPVAYLSLDDLLHSKQTGRPSDEADLQVLLGLRQPAMNSARSHRMMTHITRRHGAAAPEERRRENCVS